MKKLFYILLFLFPVIACAQQKGYKSNPLDSPWAVVGNSGFSAGIADWISLKISPAGQPYVAYEDFPNSQKATVSKFDGTNWVSVGTPDFSGAQAVCTSLAFNPLDSLPYVAYSDFGNSGKATVMKFDGTNWVFVGNAGFSVAMAVYTCLAFSPSGQPYVAYSDFGNSQKATVKKFDGTNWVNVGTEGFSVDTVTYLSFAISPSGEPYIAYQAGFYGDVKVMKFDGTNWVNAGSAGLSGGEAQYTSIAFTPSDSQPYVAYMDWQNNYKATVRKFDGSNWVDVGIAGFSAGEAQYPSLAFSPADGLLYIAFSDSWNAQKSTVMKFNGTNWVNVGNAGLSPGAAFYTCLAFSPSGQPFVSYQDEGNSFKATVIKYDSVFTGINNVKESMLSLYPNPVTDKLTIETSGAMKTGTMAIVNIEGQELISWQLTGFKTQPDISNLPAGVYFVRLTLERTVELVKFIKQ